MNIEDIVKTLPQLPQRQDATDDQLRDLIPAANRLGCYDAADFLQNWVNKRNK